MKLGHLQRWMNLESILQSAINQKEENRYHILMHIYGIYKNGIDDLICKEEIKTQNVENKHKDTKEERNSGMNLKFEVDIYTLLIQCIK